MKNWRAILIVFGILGLFAMWILPHFLRARHYNGPGIQGNLLSLEMAKAHWLDEHPNGNEWPTKRDLLPYLTNGTRHTSFDQVIRPRNQEIYIINKTGVPVYAYDPISEKLFSADSNHLQLQFLRLSK